MRIQWQKLVVITSVVIMLGAAVAGLFYALVEREFGPRSLGALTTGIGALLIAMSVLVTDRMSRKFHPESALFLWTDVDKLRELARGVSDDETRAWALSLSERIAMVLPKRREAR